MNSLVVMRIMQANFIGKSALLSRLESPAARQVVMVRVESRDCDPEGDESVMMCGKAVGYTTSGTVTHIWSDGDPRYFVATRATHVSP